MNTEEGARERLPLALLAAFMLALLAVARPVGAPEPVRACGGLVLVLGLPGFGLSLLWPGVSRRGWLLSLALAVPLSLVLFLPAFAVGVVLGWHPVSLGAAYLFGSFLVVLIGLIRSSRREQAWGAEPGAAPALLPLLVLGILLAGWAGAPVGPTTDGLDHVATINAGLRSGQLVPHDVLAPPGSVARSDPRKGILHTALAVAATLANVSAGTIWRWAPALLVPGWISLVFVLGLQLGLGRRASWAAAALALMFLGGMGTPWALRIAYGASAGLLTAWAATYALLLCTDEFTPAGVLLFSALVAAGAAVHPMAPAYVFLPALGWVGLGWVRGDRSTLRILAATAVALLISTPVLLVRLGQLTGETNPLHEQVMPILEFGGWGSVLWPAQTVAVLGPLGVLGVLLAPWVWKRLPPPAGNYLLAATGAAVLPAVVPGLFDLAHGATSSLPIKLLFVAPYAWVLGLVLSGSWRGRGGIARAGLLLGALALVPGSVERFRTRTPGREAEIRAALAAVPAGNRDSGPVVVATDPWVGLEVAAWTGWSPITVFHQHGNPLDPDGLRRLLDVGAVLSPWVDLSTTLRLLRDHQAQYVLLETPAAPRPLEVDLGCARGGSLDAERLRKFSSWPSAFAPRPAPPGWALFQRRDAGEDVTGSGARRPVRASIPGGVPVDPGDGIPARGARLLSVELPESVRPGSSEPGVLWWERRPGAGDWPVEAHLRLISLEVAPEAKPVRLLRTHLLRRPPPATRWRGVFSPFSGAWPSSVWPEGAVADSISLPLPADLEPGRYAVSARCLMRPVFTRMSLQDLLRDEDRWQGAPVDTIRVRPVFLPARPPDLIDATCWF